MLNIFGSQLPCVHGVETIFMHRGVVLIMTRTERDGETGHGMSGDRKMGTAGRRSSIRKDMLEAVKGILLRDTDSGLDWIRSFYY
jgi:hypothetical protein